MATTVAFVQQLPGILDIEGDFSANTLIVKYDTSQVDKEEIFQTIEDLGFTITGEFNPDTGEN